MIHSKAAGGHVVKAVEFVTVTIEIYELLNSAKIALCMV